MDTKKIKNFYKDVEFTADMAKRIKMAPKWCVLEAYRKSDFTLASGLYMPNDGDLKHNRESAVLFRLIKTGKLSEDFSHFSADDIVYLHPAAGDWITDRILLAHEEDLMYAYDDADVYE